VKRRETAAASEIHQCSVGVEQGANGLGLAERRRSMNRMIGRLRSDSSASIASVFEHLRDRLVATFSRHLDQAAIVQPIALGIRACVEQEPHGFDVSFARRKMHRRRVPVLRSSETRIALEQPP
jgi:hypothetical protein